MKYFIEDFTLVVAGINFLQFEGTKQLISDKYGFEARFENVCNFKYEGVLSCEISVPVEFINSRLETEQFDNESNEFLELIEGIRDDIQNEIFNYLKKHNLTMDVEF